MAERRSNHLRRIIAGGVAVVVLGGGGVAWAETRGDGPAYRLAAVTRANVEQTVTEVGSISSINQRSVSFPVGGTVASVRVAVGDTVSAGQTLATLDTTELSQEVESANGTVASAKQRLADDEADESSSDTTDSYSSYELGQTAATSSASSTGGRPTGGQSISALQAAVVADQKAVDAGLAVVASDIKALKTACASSTVTFTVSSDANGIVHGTVTGAAGLPISIPSDTDAAGAAIPPSTVASDGTYTFGTSSAPLRANASYTVQLGDSSAGVTAETTCQSALQKVQTDEQTVANDERKLAADEQKLDAAIQASASSTGGGGTTGRTGTGGTGTTGGTGSGGTGTTGGTGSSKTGGGATTGSTGSTGSSGRTGSGGSGESGTGGVITAEQLAADQKSIDAASAELVVAQQNMDAATLAAPISGTVASVSMSAGSSVSASSSSSTITILGTGQKEVTTTVGISGIDLVKKGETASVTVDGVSTALAGTVTQVGVLNTSGTSGDTTTYPVTVVLNDTSVPLYDGAGATVAINVGTATGVLTVPTSALTSVGTRALVSVYSAGKVTRQVVTTGVVGVDRTEIKSGLKAGQQVVLADMHAAVPTSTTNSRLSRLTGGGGLGSVTGGLGSTGFGGTGSGGTGFTRGGK